MRDSDAEKKEKKRIYDANRRLLKKQELNAQSREYYEKHKKEILERRAAYYQENKEHALQRDKIYRNKNKIRIRIRRAKHHILNREKLNSRSREWGQNNKDRCLETKREWKRKNPEALRAYKQNRRAREKSSGKLSGSIVKKLLSLQKGKCACCYRPLDKDFHIDHVLPLALGGANEDKNVQLTHATCNLKKRATHPIEFMQRQGFLL